MTESCLAGINTIVRHYFSIIFLQMRLLMLSSKAFYAHFQKIRITSPFSSKSAAVLYVSVLCGTSVLMVTWIGKKLQYFITIMFTLNIPYEYTCLYIKFCIIFTYAIHICICVLILNLIIWFLRNQK